MGKHMKWILEDKVKIVKEFKKGEKVALLKDVSVSTIWKGYYSKVKETLQTVLVF